MKLKDRRAIKQLSDRMYYEFLKQMIDKANEPFKFYTLL